MFHLSGRHPHSVSAVLNLNGFLWKQNASLEKLCESAKMPMRSKLQRETEWKRETVLWRRDNTKLVWVACQDWERNITLTPTLARRSPHGISMAAKLWQSLSNQGPVALNYWAVTSNNNSCISKAHEIIWDLKPLWSTMRSWRSSKWKMANRRRPLLIWRLALSQAEVAARNSLRLERIIVGR